jgi:hypothetical protein
VLSMTLLAEVPELGTLGHEQIAALVGVAPLNRVAPHHLVRLVAEHVLDVGESRDEAGCCAWATTRCETSPPMSP